jgi:adenosylmethionine-8-amino-7-oxononanoate aminotransferase
MLRKKRSQWRETKRQQRNNLTVLESHRNSSREYQRRRLQMLRNLQENNSKLEDKVEQLEKMVESQNEQIVALILENFRLVSQNARSSHSSTVLCTTNLRPHQLIVKLL